MNYKYTLTVETEQESEIFKMSTSSWEDFQESIVRKAEHSVKRYEDEMEAYAQAEFDRQQEEEAEAKAQDAAFEAYKLGELNIQ
jgi:hypothetical protein